MGKSITVGVPGFIISKVDLNKGHTSLHQVFCHEQRPAEGVLSIAFLNGLWCISYIKRILYFGIRQKGDGTMVESVEACGIIFHALYLGIQLLSQGRTIH